VARELSCSLLVDEFYSHYVWRDTADGDGLVSAARYVDDVDTDPVVIFDGLTKNWRYPGWRVTWTLGPKRVIEAVTSAGSFLDGGGSAPMQRAAAEILSLDYVELETAAIRCAFRLKRDLLVRGLRELGVRFDLEPEGTFYAWGDLSALPASIDTGETFFRAALQKKVITVPGTFFGVDPGQRRHGRPSRFRHHMRFSFGPEQTRLEEALRRLREVVSEAA
jgi:aspartate/methionine/tyrosine aminotransferase